MNHGGGESGRLHGNSHRGKRKSGDNGDEFAQMVAKIAVAQICESVGFQSFQESALETLSDVATWYIWNLGKTAQLYANMAGRTEGNVFDIIQGLEDLGLPQGFAGALDVDRCLASSATVGELVRYIDDAEDIPFAYSIPHFPVVRERKPALSFYQTGEEPPAEHIPSWLPAFPDPQTYMHLPKVNEGGADSDADKLELAGQHQKMDGSSLNLQQQFTCNASEGPSYVTFALGAKAKEGAGSNPFLTAPLQFGEKEVSHIVPPIKLPSEVAVRYPVEQNLVMDNNHMPVLETFAPAIESMKSRLCDSEEGQKKVVLNQRSTVKFKIGAGKKSLGGALDLRLQNKSLIGKDSENDDKKRRAEKILKQSMENPGELAQL